MGNQVGDFAYDLYKGAKAGPHGIAAAVAKKALELTVFGPPTYYDAKFELSAYLPSSYTEGAKKVGKRMIKTAMGAPVKDRVQKYLLKHERKIFDKMIGRLYSGTWLNKLMAEFPNIPMEQHGDNIMKILDKQGKKLVKATESFKKSISQQGKLKIGASLVKDFTKGIVKDIAKDAIKKRLADLFEGQAMQKYMLAQYKLQGSAILLLRTSNQYWMTKDAYDTMVAVRNTIIEKYDPFNHMVIEYSNTAKLKTGTETYHIALVVSYKKDSFESPRQMDVILGNVKAERDPNGYLVFSIPFDEIKNVKDRKTGAKLEIKVLK